MDKQKIDRLFREKLHDFEIAPSSQAWVEVEKQINTRSASKGMLRVAAAVVSLLLIVKWLIWLPETNDHAAFVTPETNHPQLAQSLGWQLPTPAKEINNTKKATKGSNMPTQRVEQLVEQEKFTGERSTVGTSEKAGWGKLEAITLNAVATVMEVETEAPVMIQTDRIEADIEGILPKIKMTYIASESMEKQKKDSVRGFKRLVAFAKKISPMDMLSGIKSAKDNLVRNGFKFKGKDRKKY